MYVIWIISWFLVYKIIYKFNIIYPEIIVHISLFLKYFLMESSDILENVLIVIIENAVKLWTFICI